jgi:hypothetical protein
VTEQFAAIATSCAASDTVITLPETALVAVPPMLGEHTGCVAVNGPL